MKFNFIHRILLASMTSLMFVACANDDIDSHGEKQILEMIPYCSSFVSADKSSNAHTRALPDNYVKYSEMTTTPEDQYAKIRAYLATQKNGGWTVDGTGMFYHTSGDAWASTVQVDPVTQYYVYGFMPAGSATGTIASEDYTQGATLTLTDLSTIVPADVCAIVGVLKGPTDDASVTDIESISETVTPGKYSYLSSQESQKNTIYILLDHIYSCVNLNFAVDPTYNELRKITLKKVVMKTTTGAATVTAVIKLTTSSSNPMSQTITPDGSTSGTTAEIFSGARDLTTSYSGIPGYFTPGVSSLIFDVETTYDVYDMSNGGNLVRENCVATNKITISDSSAASGKIYTVNIMVQPTYLYQLSNPDLDNPSFVVTE